MPRASTVHAVIAIGIDLGKSTLHMIGLNSRGAIVLREKVSRGRIALRSFSIARAGSVAIGARRHAEAVVDESVETARARAAEVTAVE